MTDKKDKKKDKKAEGPEQSRGNKFAELEQKAGENLAGWQKALADYQNLEREMENRLSGMAEFTTATFILELLPIFDNYQTAITHIPEDQKESSWAVGLEHILKMWEGFLNDHGVEVIKTVGEKFDTAVHESIGEVNEKDQKDQIIVEEKMAGYKIKDRVVRPAKVIINNLK